MSDKTPRAIAKTDEFHYYSALFRAPDGSVVLDRVQTGAVAGAVLLGPELHSSLMIQGTYIRQSDISTTGETFVKQHRDGWVAYKIGPPLQRIRAGTGSVLSVSDEAVAYVEHGTVRIEGIDGKLLGSFTAEDASRGTPTIRFLGNDRLWFSGNSREEVRDFSGKTLQTLDRPDGWGFRIGQSSDGNRLLYDRYTRHIPLAKKIWETVIAVATLGMGVADEESSGEEVLVIDAKSGKRYFEWSSSGAVLLLASGFHADIDPSGRLVAIMTRTMLAVYSLPDAGATK